ncbi:MAG: hypothetical protein KAY32_16700 [Candidatus Eisenbacteria sp.]|nr:hypothetical protein [Candidatus Eisenbacteria bacterium]
MKAIRWQAMRRDSAAALLIGVTLLWVSAVPALSQMLAGEPADFDAAVDEAARKIAFYEKLTRAGEEPTANQLALDACYYDLALTIDPVAETVAGTLTARLQVTAAQVQQVDLDLADELSVDAVTLGGFPASYTHSGDVVAITLDRIYTQGEEVEVAVTYSGTPPSSYGAFGFDTYGGEPMIWTLSEPFGARSWWPCDDWSDDKADSLDLHITVPAGLVVASNGSLRAITDHGGTETYWWHEQYPIATYLVSLAIHPYTVYSDYYVAAPDDSLEIQFYIFPDHVDDFYDVNAMTKDMIGYFSDVYGDYPFKEEKYGHAEFLWGGGMEHQTCTSLGAFYESIVAHELAHQWWGDMVTCADFHHIWLNEGFARYSEALWLEHNYGPTGYWDKMNSTRYYGEGTIYVPDLGDWGRIFHTGLSYNKASWVVHMLRGVLGEEDFFAFLTAYRTAFAYGAATTAGLQAVAESVSGLDLDDFFQQWIYGEYYPLYEFAWEDVIVRDGHELHLAIDQTQTNTGPFHMPIEIRVGLVGGGSEEFVIDNALAHEEYVLSLSGPAEQVELDPDDWILRRVQEAVVDPSFREGILLVNGVHWDTYGSEIVQAYENRAFWGDLEIDFWDYFDNTGDYPATLPEPLGHGRVPSDVLGNYLAVIWIGNNYNGDIDGWVNTSVLPYLEAGGNVLLMTRRGDDFLDADLGDYLGIDVLGTGYLYDCVSVHPDLSTISRIGTQSYCMTFDRSLGQATSTLLYEARSGYTPDRGIGVLRVPAEGGSHNPKGGQFAFLSGRPYRWDHADLAANVETIIGWFQDAWADAPEASNAVRPRLDLRLASPVHGETPMRFSLPRAGVIRLVILDSQGRIIRDLADGDWPAGEHHLTWDGRGTCGLSVPSGRYYVLLREGAAQISRPLVLVH